MIGHDLGRAIDDGGAQVEHGGVFEGFQDDFVANAIDIAVGDADFYLVLFHRVALFVYLGFNNDFF